MKFISIKPQYFSDLIEYIWIIENNSEEKKSIIIFQNQYPNISFSFYEKSYCFNGKQIEITQIEGTYKRMLILEKLLIYSYPLWSGHPDLVKPSGCEIFR